ncbi:MAG: oligopeptidase A, partial [Gammaproteobacteria bacterium]
MTTNNPLLDAYPLPAFDVLDAEQITPAVDARLAAGRAVIDSLSQVDNPTWESVIDPFEQAADDLDRTWSPVRHLNSVADTPIWREAYNGCLSKLSEYHTEVGQNETLYQIYEQLRDSTEYNSYSCAQRAVIKQALR